ncbi:uncharacterized protein LOC135386103 [Ornithodoros turicata]|uniref:uncharacterized protein LOC135386103 n=1 Tax=Ornithodoros turicata TaxID=34597 RepID=UPI00313862DD
MGDESAMSGVSGMSGMEPGPGGAPGAGAPTAEGIVKKMSTYWFLIGAVPLVLFLLVAIPNVLIVHHASSYVNAFYCNTPACAQMAGYIEKAEKGAKPCDDFFAHVCDAVDKDISMDDALVHSYDQKNLNTDKDAFKATPPHIASFIGQQPITRNCDSKSIAVIVKWLESLSFSKVKTIKTLPAASKPPYSFPYVLPLSGPPPLSFEKALVTAHQYGVDIFYRLSLVHSPWKDVGAGINYPQPATVEIEISAPSEEFDAMHLAQTKKLTPTIKAVLEKMLRAATGKGINDVTEANTLANAIDAFDKSLEPLIANSTDFDSRAAPVVWTLDELAKSNIEGATKGGPVELNLASFISSVTGKKIERVIVRHPKYVVGLADNMKQFMAKHSGTTLPSKDFLWNIFVTYIGIRMVLGVFGMQSDLTGVKLDSPAAKYFCYYQMDALIPTLFASVVEPAIAKRWTAYNGILTYDAKRRAPYAAPLKPHAAVRILVEDVRDSIAKSFALSTTSNEKSRMNLYLKLKSMNLVVFYLNTTGDKQDLSAFETEIDGVAGGKATDDGVPKMRKKLMEAYWKIASKNTPALLADPGFLQTSLFKHRLMATRLFGAYSYGTNSLYVSPGVFSTLHFKDSYSFMLNYARIGYFVGRNMLKALDQRGGNVYPGVHLPGDWRGSHTAKKFVDVLECFALKKLPVGSLYDTVMDSIAVSPALRYYRTIALQRAFPQPEYRLDKVEPVSQNALFFYGMMTPLCELKTSLDFTGAKPGSFPARVNVMLSGDKYFQETFCKETPGKLASDMKALLGTSDKPGCYFWNSTRKNY